MAGMSARVLHATRGSSLLEAVVAAGLLATVLTAILPLVTASVAGTAASRGDLMAAHLARQRLAHLQALTHVRTPAGVLVDQMSRLDEASPFGVGGPGLTASGLGPLQASAPLWVDWLDAHGAWQGGGAVPPARARYRRRWAILATGQDTCVRLWVEVVPLGPSVGHRTSLAGGIHCPWGVTP
jgi:hypothetical protein